MKVLYPPYLMDHYEPSRPGFSRSLFRYLLLALLLSVFYTLAGCNATTQEQASIPEGHEADEFMIVDCLLPGQVRKLGNNFTYLTQRRPIKTATSDCEIRGGEYVAYDRANYSTALKIWLPMAQAGDATAQTYVGEIYEKGLGLTPDYEVAAHWYRLAAEQKFSRAQINLGHLYEKGLGVAPDQQKALNLYRLASGIEGDSLLFASTLNATYVPREDYEAKEAELQLQTREAERLQKKIAEIDRNLARQTQNLAATENQLFKTEKALKELTSQQAPIYVVADSESETAKAREAALKAQIEKMTEERKQLRELLAESNQQNQALALHQQSLSERLRQQEQTKAEYQRQLREMELALSDSRTSLVQSEQALQAVQARLTQTQREAENAGAETTPLLESLHAEVAAKNADLDKQRQQLAALETENQDKIAKLRQVLSELSDQQHAVLLENQDYENQLREMGQQLQQREQQLADANRQLDTAEHSLRLLSEGQMQLSEREEKLVQQIATLEGERTQLSQQLASHTDENQQLADKQKILRDQLLAAESTKAGYNQQLGDLHRELQESRQGLEEAQHALAEVEQQLQREKASGAQLTPAILALQDDLADKNRLLIDEQKRFADLEAKNRAEQEKLLASVAELEQQQAAMRAENRRYKQQLTDLNASLRQREQALQGMDQQLLLSKAELQMARAESEAAMTALSAEHEAAMEEQRLQLAELSKNYEQQLALAAAQRHQISELQKEAEQAWNAMPAPAAAPPLALAAAHDYPGIEIIEPPVVLTRSRAAVRVHRIHGERQVVGKVMAPAGLMSLSVNGKSQQVMENNLFRTSVALQGDPTPVDVVVVDKKGRRAAVSFSFIGQDKRPQSLQKPAPVQTASVAGGDIALGDYYALIIGNNNYQHFSTLATAVNDAREAEQLLRYKYNFRTRLLLNADRYTILSTLNELRQSLKPEDNLLIYYAGHGKLDESNNRGYWLPVDAETDNTSNWISNTAITDILNVTEAKHILVVADSCYSGTLTQTPLARVETDIPADVRDQWIKVMNETRARITLTSGGVEPVLDGGGGRHSVFAKAFIDALRENNTLLEGYSLYSQVLDRMENTPAAAGQVPQYAPIHLAGHESGEFFFKPI